MKLNEMLPSRFLKKEDVPAPVLVTIRTVTQEVIDNDTGEQKWAMHFQEFEKPLALNTTNLQIAFAACGVDDSDDMPGHKLVLYTDPNVSYQGKLIGGLRLRAPKQAPAKSARVEPAAPAADMSGLDDDVPF